MLNELCSLIRPLDQAAIVAATAQQERLTKPAGALGRLEALSIQLAGIQGTAQPHVDRPVVIVAAADHGVAAAGVSAYPQAVTAQMVGNFLAGGAAINVLARTVGAEVVVVDAGVASDLTPHPQLRVLKIASGTANLLQGPAMSLAQARLIIERGVLLARELIEAGCDLLALGEMGIGNTTATAIITAALTGLDAAAVTGRGTGLDDTQFAHKQAVVDQALVRHRAAQHDGLALLAAAGGYEIGLLVGCCLGAAAQQVPVLIDGYITTAAALIAAKLCPAVLPYYVAAHCSQEPGHRHALAHLGLRPLLDLDLRLGEGSGAALALPILRAAVATLREMATFTSAGVAPRTDD